MKSLITALLLVSLTAGVVDGIQCHSCQYTENPDGIGVQCMTARENETLASTECPTTCQESVTLKSDNTVFVFSRGCARNESDINCCDNAGSMIRCFSFCDDSDFCNNASYDQSSPINSLARCPAPVVDGSIPCNFCAIGPGDEETSCLDSPLSPRVGYLQCPTETKECTIISMRYVADDSQIFSYSRSCYPKGSLSYGKTVDSTYITWMCHCNTPYCNDNVGDGEQAECHPTGEEYYYYYETNFGNSNKFRRQSSSTLAAQLVAIITVSSIATMTASYRP